MQTASSANLTWSAPVSASEWTATVRMPSARQARRTRMAISPRLAMRTFLNKALALANPEQLLAELDRLAVLGEDLDDRARDVGLDLVHELHRLDDAECLA